MKSHHIFAALDCDPTEGHWIATRCSHDPIIHAGLDPSIGENIQGPSLIRVPEWIDRPLGNYYLYFADHKGSFIRLAYADELTGPWRIYQPGSLHLNESQFPTGTIPKPSGFKEGKSLASKLLHSREYELSTPHIASPDVHIDHENREIYMYFHGLEGYGVQQTRLATSRDGIDFSAEKPILCPTYLRVVPFGNRLIGMVMPGVIFNLESIRGPFENGQRMFPLEARHHAILVNNNRLFVFWSEVGDAPEHIKTTVIAIDADHKFKIIKHLGAILKPEMEWEGVHEKNEPSVRSVAYGRVNQLRDPGIFVEDDRVYLLYAGGGESAIGIAELVWQANHE